MPQLPLLLIQRVIQLRSYHILHTNQSGRIGRCIVNETLSDLNKIRFHQDSILASFLQHQVCKQTSRAQNEAFCSPCTQLKERNTHISRQMGTVVVCLNAPARITRIRVECIQMSADGLQWAEGLSGCGSGF